MASGADSNPTGWLSPHDPAGAAGAFPLFEPSAAFPSVDTFLRTTPDLVAMAWFGSRAREEREHVISAVQSLGPTNVDVLSIALSWPARKTERVVREIVRHGGTPLEFDLVHGAVRMRAAISGGARASPEPVAAPAAPGVPVGPAPPTSGGVPAVRTTPAPRCLYCHRLMQPADPGATKYVCGSCGHLGSTPAAKATPAPGVPTGGPIPDRRSQEMFAAYVTSRPIPCPRCRTTLRHRGVGEYGCPGCGEVVSFGKDGVPKVTRPASGAA